jgi:D-lactate dehydrogenase
MHAACAAIVPLRDSGAKALELLDRASLRSVETQPGVPSSIRTLPGGAAALLVEYQAENESERKGLEELAAAAVAPLALLEPARFTHDATEQALLWKVRQGTFPSVGAARKSGTTVLIEDVAFPIEHLADAAVDLTSLFVKHGYPEAIIFGHAKDGNLHFVITQSFNDQAALDKYSTFIDEVVELVVKKYDGALKAEHGTGRNMAPFVETEWGPEAYAVMKRLKALCDPDGILNPGVILNADPRCHLKDVKPMPTVEEEVDKCIECGYCEPKCPSRELTLTPRQRIVLRREMTRLEAEGTNAPLLAALEAEFPYAAVDTCAVDGLCATACPVSIDTGQLTKRLRKARHSERARKVALALARRFATVEPLLRTGLRAGHLVQSLFGAGAMAGVTRAMRAVVGKPFPQWSAEMPRAAKAARPVTTKAGAVAVYFPACISRTMGALPGEPSESSLMEAFVEIGKRAGTPVFIPEDVEGVCCGVPFSSKGYTEANAFAANRAIERFWAWSDEGRLPIVVDTSPCTYGVKGSRPNLTPENQARFDRLTILDGVAFTHDALLPKLTARRKAGSVALHPVCSLTKMNLGAKLEGIARFCSDDVTVPLSAGCCAFAGDRGFLHPELTASATKHEAAEVKAKGCEEHLSSSRTCEIGMTRATGEIYRSYVFLLEKVTRN